MGSITNLNWRIKRNGSKTDTSYTIIPLAKDEAPFDFSKLELFDLEKTAVRNVPYADQESFYMGESSQELAVASTGSVEW